MDLQWKILIGIAGGLVLGLVFNRLDTIGPLVGVLGVLKLIFSYGGDIFIRLLRMLIVPLVFASIFMSIVRLGNLRELKKIGASTLLYYLATTALAVFVGMIMVNLVHPGLGVNSQAIQELNIQNSIPDAVLRQNVGQKNAIIIIIDTLVDMIPTNPIAALAKADILQVIFFSILMAIVAASLGKRVEPFVKVVENIDDMMNRAIFIVMEIAPICIFFLVTQLMMDLGFSVLAALGKYAITVLSGLFFHAVITLPLLVFFVGKYNPFRLFKSVLPAIMTAWSTASSTATLPITMECMEKRAGVDRKIGSFVLPLGATINMDGTALYESVAVIFIAELLGVPLSLNMQVIIFVTATLAAIGAAAIPGAGLVTMGIVLSAVGLPLEGIGLILAVDRILDQFRTAVNVWGDTTAAVVVGRMENAIDVSSTPLENVG